MVAFLSLSSWYLVIGVWHFLAVAWVCLQFVIEVFPDHTHLLLFYQIFEMGILAYISCDFENIRRPIFKPRFPVCGLVFVTKYLIFLFVLQINV